MAQKSGSAWDTRLPSGSLAGPILLSLASWIIAILVAVELYSSGWPASLAVSLGVLVLALPALLWLVWQLKERP